MAITVKHSKVSAIPDDTNTDLVRPSDWNADHVLTGTVPIVNGGTGATTANDGLNALLPTQTGNSGKVLTTDGTNANWSTNGVGSVTSVGTGTGLTGGPITDSGTINFSNSAVGAWAANPTSGNLAAAVSDETGSGSLVFGNAPTLSAPLIDGSNPYIQFNNGSAVALAAGRQWYDGVTGSWNLGMGGGNITQQVGEELFLYGKASSAITDSPLQIVYQSGTVGASGVITFAPTISGLTDGNLIVGVSTEPISTNAFGRVTTFGVIHGITTNGAAYGETWHDGDTIWYNSVTGNPTNVKPSAPNIKVSVGTIINAGSGGSGSFQVEINHGSVLGGTDSNVQLTSPSNGNILTYDGANAYWKNTDVVAGTGISISKSTNGVLTVINTAPSSGGTVTSITAGTGLTGGTITGSGTIAIDSSVATLTGTQTLSNKRITLKIGTVTSSATITPTSDTSDQYNVTALATTAVFAAPSGTPTDGQKLTIRIKDSGSGQSMSWTATSGAYRAIGVTLPTTIAASKTIYVGCIWNAADSFWDVVSVATQA